MLIEDSNKDNYKQNSEQFNHKCTYVIHKCTYKLHLQWQLGAGKPAGACGWGCYEYCVQA